MPLLKTAQTHKCLNQEPQRSYIFPDQQKPQWEEFWKEMDGDRDKILDFAEKSEIQNPEDWYEELHRFLFDYFAGDPKLLERKAAKKNFGEFLKQVAENHINDPKDKYWYFSKGLKPKDFIRVMEFAGEFTDPSQAINYINARTPEFGAKLYSEYILSKTKQNKELITIASELNKKAYNIEKEITSAVMCDEVKADTVIKHARFPGEKFKVITSSKDEENEMITVQDKNGNLGYIFDVWNIESVNA